ncbi:MAG: DHHA1 domain-containing protein [Candidatus Paceibacterota bacterium]
MDKEIIVFYHGKCLDGFSSAWVAWKKFGDKADYIPVSDHGMYPEGVEGKIVYMVDFTFLKEVFEQIQNNAEKVIAIDHHETVEQVTKLADDYSYAVNNSAAVLTWKYFNPDKSVPRFLLYVEDQDIWNFDLAKSKEILSFMDSQDMNFETWDDLINKFEDDDEFEKILEIGDHILSFKERAINRVSSRAYLVSFEGHKTLAINSSSFMSELGYELYTKVPPIAIVWYEQKEGIKVSLRSDGSADVGSIAKKYGGGGHRASAGFKLPLRDRDSLPWHRIDD